MEFFIGVTCMLIFGYIYEQWKDKQEREERFDTNEALYAEALAKLDKERKEEKAKKFMEDHKGTRDLFLETLKKIGCQFQLAEEEGDDRIFFPYQGENFFVRATNETWYIQIYDTHWWRVDMYDIDEFSRLRKVINESNLKNSVTTVYTIDEEDSKVYVHCKSSILLFIPHIPYIEEYLKIELNEFFRVHQYVNIEMAKQREKEKSCV